MRKQPDKERNPSENRKKEGRNTEKAIADNITNWLEITAMEATSFSMNKETVLEETDKASRRKDIASSAFEDDSIFSFVRSPPIHNIYLAESDQYGNVCSVSQF